MTLFVLLPFASNKLFTTPSHPLELCPNSKMSEYIKTGISGREEKKRKNKATK